MSDAANKDPVVAMIEFRINADGSVGIESISRRGEDTPGSVSFLMQSAMVHLKELLDSGPVCCRNVNRSVH